MNGDTQEQKTNARWSFKKSLVYSSDEFCNICKSNFSFSSPKKICVNCKSLICVLHSRKRFVGQVKQQVCDNCAFPDLNVQIQQNSDKESAEIQFILESLKSWNLETLSEIQELRKAEFNYKSKADTDINRNREQVNELKSSLDLMIKSQEINQNKLISIQNEIRNLETKLATDKNRVELFRDEIIALSLNKDHVEAHFNTLENHLEDLHHKVLNSVPASIIGPKLCAECQTNIFGSIEIVRRSFVMDYEEPETIHDRQSHCNECLLL